MPGYKEMSVSLQKLDQDSNKQGRRGEAQLRGSLGASSELPEDNQTALISSIM